MGWISQRETLCTGRLYLPDHCGIRKWKEPHTNGRHKSATMKTNKLMIILLFAGSSAAAQDPEFSQYYAAPLYLNPAFAGTSVDHRFIANYRNQWPNVSQAFETYAFSYDYNLDQYNSGLGFMIMADKAGSANLKSTQFNFQYAYKVKLSDRFILS